MVRIDLAAWRGHQALLQSLLRKVMFLYLVWLALSGYPLGLAYWLLPLVLV